MDKSKGIPPQYSFQPLKVLEKNTRPKIIVHLAMAHGYCCDFYLADDENFSWRLLPLRDRDPRTGTSSAHLHCKGAKDAEDLVVQSDNTTSQAKSAEVISFNIRLEAIPISL